MKRSPCPATLRGRRVPAGARLLVLAALVLAGALALASPTAAAARQSELDVWDYQPDVGRPADVELELVVSTAAAPTAKATVYVPVGYGVDTSAAPGTSVGDVFATLAAGSALFRGGGKVVVADPADYLDQTCAPGVHAAVWKLKIAIAGQEVDVPVFVDPATPDVARFASYTLQACFTEPVDPTGLRFEDLDVDLSSGFTNPTATASHLWRALLTPFGADGTPSLAGTTELQASVPLPQRLTVATRYLRKRHAVVVSGTVVAAGHPRARVAVHFLASRSRSFGRGTTIFGTARTDSSGRFTLTHRLTATTYVVAYMNLYYAVGCSATVGAAPCTTKSISPPAPVLVHAVVKR